MRWPIIRRARRKAELLSAYVDSRLSPQERAEVERRIAESPEWRAEMEALRGVVALAQQAPRALAPRSFALTPEMAAAQARRRPRAAPLRPIMSMATAAAAILLAFSVAGGMTGLFSGHASMPAPSAATQTSSPLPAPQGVSPTAAVTEGGAAGAVGSAGPAGPAGPPGARAAEGLTTTQDAAQIATTPAPAPAAPTRAPAPTPTVAPAPTPVETRSALAAGIPAMPTPAPTEMPVPTATATPRPAPAATAESRQDAAPSASPVPAQKAAGAPAATEVPDSSRWTVAAPYNGKMADEEGTAVPAPGPGDEAAAPGPGGPPWVALEIVFAALTAFLGAWTLWLFRSVGTRP